MLLQRLVEYGEEHGEATPFHRERLFSWRLNLNADGTFRSLRELMTTDAKGRPRAVPHTTPSAVRTVGVAANLAADDVQYVLGWGDPDSKPARVAQCHATFVDLVQRWADSDEGKDDLVAQAVAAFYRSEALSTLRREDYDYTAKQGVLIFVDGVPAYRAPSVVPFWTAEVARRKGGGADGLCLVCGRVRPLLDTVPGKVPARFVPGASNDAALVSINERVFGYGLSMQLSSTPLCVVCGEAMTAALIDLLSSRNAASYGGQDSRLTWWVTGGADAGAMHLLDEPDPERVSELLQSVHSGRTPTSEDLAKIFYSLTVGGNVARVMVRDWVEMPLPKLRQNIGKWFAEHEIATRWQDRRRYHSLTRFALVTGRWLQGTQRYVDFGTKGSDRPADVQRDLIRAAIRGTPLPPSLLAHLVHRVCTDGRLDEPRAALIRLALNRSPFAPEKPMPPDLDETNTDPAYVAGRVFATLEQLQYDASEGKLNTTYSDRFFSGAVLNPQAAIVNGRRDANAWLRKLRRQPKKRGAAIHHERQLNELFGLINSAVGLPARTTLRQQSMFLLGYHHQRAHHFASLPVATAPEETS
ncbi:MAG TPA: type I-C CRISPR-associated protein Cas8c/Csd1 [Pseudonocardiaceae bacterium]|jgi:CRISPR-associated protein Csd1|nr:type I-C CRISPR-associated protein Cas8c/Csd1 [Pseudonocardiaceae bacterium]